jgi:hypothetical protein
VHLEVPAMERYRGILFRRHAGLDSVFEHNTDASMEWLPNTGLALVAVGVDPPLSHHDIELIRKLEPLYPEHLGPADQGRYARRGRSDPGRRLRSANNWGDIGTYPCRCLLTRSGPASSISASNSTGSFSRAPALAPASNAPPSCGTRPSRCWPSAGLSQRRAEGGRVRRFRARTTARKIVGQRESPDDTRLTLRLIARHAAAGAPAAFEDLLRRDEAPVRQRLLDDLEREFPAWTRSLSVAMERFDKWLRAGVTREMAALSWQHRGGFLEPAGAPAASFRSVSRTFGTGWRSKPSKLWVCLSGPLK